MVIFSFLIFFSFLLFIHLLFLIVHPSRTDLSSCSWQGIVPLIGSNCLPVTRASWPNFGFPPFCVRSEGTPPPSAVSHKHDFGAQENCSARPFACVVRKFELITGYLGLASATKLNITPSSGLVVLLADPSIIWRKKTFPPSGTVLLKFQERTARKICV